MNQHASPAGRCGPGSAAPPDVRASVAFVIAQAGFFNDRGLFDRLANCLAAEVVVDSVSLFGGEVSTLNRETLIERYRARLPGCDFNQHMISCVDVCLEPDGTALACSNFRATHRVDDRLWIVGGLYTHRLAFEDDAWRITFIGIELGYEEGDRSILDVAAQRVMARSVST